MESRVPMCLPQSIGVAERLRPTSQDGCLSATALAAKTEELAAGSQLSKSTLFYRRLAYSPKFTNAGP